MTDSPDLPDRLVRGAPEPPDLALLAQTVEGRARRRRTGRRGLVAGALTAVVVVAVVVPLSLTDRDRPEPAGPAFASPSSPSTSPTGEVPDDCVAQDEADRADLDGSAVWARLCRGPDGLTRPAEVPSDALTTHLEFVAAIGSGARTECPSSSVRTYRLQVGFADGTVAQVAGRTGPGCVSLLAGIPVTGPPDLGVYGAAMAAYGKQYADALPSEQPTGALACPTDPRRPGSVDVDGASAALDTGYRYGRREPMVMPVAAVRGILCTWQDEGSGPELTELSPADAERVRIGLHTVYEATVDCSGSPGPTYTAVVEDKTGTRRAVTLVTSECSTVIASKKRFGLGFPWLDVGDAEG